MHEMEQGSHAVRLYEQHGCSVVIHFTELSELMITATSSRCSRSRSPVPIYSSP